MRRPAIFPFCLALGLAYASAQPAHADVIILVDTTADVIANDGACSLREAIVAANNNANYFGCIGSGGGYDLIEFSIGAGTPVIAISSALPDITGPLEVNGGPSRVELRRVSGPSFFGLRLTGAGTSGSVIRNLVIQQFAGAISLTNTSNVTIAGNYIGTNAAGTESPGLLGPGILLSASTAQIGGTTGVTAGGPCTGDCNLINGSYSWGGIELRPGSTATIRGNHIGVNAAGTAATILSDGTGEFTIYNDIGILVENSWATIGGTATGAGNLISNNTYGIEFRITTASAVGSVIQGNRIGSNGAGTVAIPNAKGIEVSLGNQTYPLTIGGSAAGAGNLISGNSGWGILLNYSNGVIVQGNRIGTQADGVSPLPNVGPGIDLRASTQSIAIGGTGAGQGNVVAYNGTGVKIGLLDAYNTVRGNSIRSNTGMGIQLADFQNNTAFAPLINGVAPVSGTACPGCVVDVYSDAADEGGTYHGTVTADGGGNWVFNGAVTGPNITATATSALGSTSEFSTPYAYAPTDTDGDGVPNSTDNCSLLSNPTQCDSDNDGYGNRCDADLGPGTGNGFTNAQDTTLFRAQLGQPSVAPGYNRADINCNGVVNAQDTTLFRSLLGLPPGPSGLHP